jgi:pimeloyl-ACP methyl ester carboxylesterase
VTPKQAEAEAEARLNEARAKARLNEANTAARLNEVIATYGLADYGISDHSMPSSKKRRRGYDPQDYDGLATVSLVRTHDGILRWGYQPPGDGMSTRRARQARRGAGLIGAEIIHSFSFRETPPNQVISALEELDKKLTPKQGLRLLEGKELKPDADGIEVQGRTLLLVHGTFSSSDMYVTEFGAIAAQKDLLGRAPATYEKILAFDHPTLSVSPWINALDLERALRNVTGPIDVICHSRGGLVVAWWLRNSKRNVEKVVFVGSPLEGTSLASPARLRSALDMLANVISAFEATATAASIIAPLAAGAAGLAKIVGGMVQLGANTPLADAAVAIVPGLAGQSRVGNNAELIRLTRAPWASIPTHYAVTSIFRPGADDTTPWWQFWKRFTQLPGKILSYGADVIFEADNDLVVDTASMSLICGGLIPGPQICDFGISPTVHHCNYFRQEKTVEKLAEWLNIEL